MFELNEEQSLVKKSVHEFAGKELAPQAAYWDTSEEFPWESVEKWHELSSRDYGCQPFMAVQEPTS
jgi:alkylation response protein AidB-like acyl-CoA dehydrogenase